MWTIRLSTWPRPSPGRRGSEASRRRHHLGVSVVTRRRGTGKGPERKGSEAVHVDSWIVHMDRDVQG